MAKETIYIEADDEITTVIEKVVAAKDAIVAIVLPKRATVFQSVVNMKLLKKAAAESKKRVVLISSEPSIQSIAAVAGVHLASSLNSKPAIPKRAKTTSVATISSNELDTSVTDSDDEIASDESSVASNIAKTEQSDTIELDNTSTDAKEVPAGTIAQTANETQKKKSRMPKIPDFGSFQLKLWLGIFVAVLLIVGWFVGFVVMPKAIITINTDTSSAEVAFDFVATTDAETLDIQTATIPATIAEIAKENSVTVPATGEKNVGEVARGNAEFTARVCAPNLGNTPQPLVAGIGVSSGGKTYILQEDLTFSFTGLGGSCANYATDEGVIVAQGQGSSYNTSNATFAVAGRSDATGTGSASGGTDSIVKVVSAQDIVKATEQLKGASRAEAIEELKVLLADKQLQPLSETIEESAPAIKSTPAVDTEASELIVTQTITYKMLGVESNDLGELLDAKIAEEIKDVSDKSVRNNGLGSAVYRLTTKASATSQTINVQTVATLGALFDQSAIAEEVRGKKRGDIEKLLESREGVRSVSVEYRPFWITTTPKSAQKIEIVINEVEN